MSDYPRYVCQRPDYEHCEKHELRERVAELEQQNARLGGEASDMRMLLAAKDERIASLSEQPPQQAVTDGEYMGKGDLYKQWCGAIATKPDVVSAFDAGLARGSMYYPCVNCGHRGAALQETPNDV